MILNKPPDSSNVIGWILQKWLSNLYERVIFEGSFITVDATPYTVGPVQTVLVDDDTVGGAVTVNLPPASESKRVYHVKKLGTTGNVTIDGDGSETIDGATTYVMSTQYQTVSVLSDGVGWYIV